MAELEERILTFLKNIPHGGGEEESGDGGGGGDTFAERAEWFFKKRPELLNLVQELYNNYISLKHQRKHSCSSSPFDNKDLSIRVVPTIPSSQDTRTQFGLQHINYFHNLIDQQQQEEQEIDTSWDIESSVSYHQTPSTTIPDIDEDHHHGKHLFRTGSWCSSPYDVVSSSFSAKSRTGLDDLVSHIVIKNVEEELIKAQMGELEHQNRECTRKMEILNKLVEVLESERVVLLDENSRLGYKVSNLMQENQELGSESVFLKRKAAQLTRCLMRIREDHSVCVLTRKIEDLQEQIHGLEKRNQDFFEIRKMKNKMKKKEGFDLGLMGCFQSEKMKFKKKKEEDGVEGVKRGRKLWEKVKKGINFPMFSVHGVSSSSSISSSVAT
ncbi:kinase interacting (KIP1-like) family protein [Euphorbia peplus]|nr:kinase interacting (KIP1-like) family protein [Euphorbia peplus]